MQNKGTVMVQYNYLKSLVKERKQQFDRLMEFMENETEWFKAPASTRFHLSVEMGLLIHIVNVASTLLKVKNTLSPGISDESCIIVAFIHDMGKVGMPGKPQYLVNEPTEKQIKYGYKPEHPYRFNCDLTYLSVPVRSLYLVSKYIELTEEEVQAVIYHDGQYVDDNRSCANKETPLTLLLQYADSWSGFVLEKQQEVK